MLSKFHYDLDNLSDDRKVLLNDKKKSNQLSLLLTAKEYEGCCCLNIFL